MTTTAIDTESRTLRLERDFRAPIERVFDAFTNPEYVRQWWGPEGLHTSVVEMDCREGGKWLTTMVGDEGVRYTVEGEYKLIERPNRLVYTWFWIEGAESHAPSTIDIRLTQIEGGTRLTLVHSLFESIEERDDHSEGWTSSLNCLEAFLNKK